MMYTALSNGYMAGFIGGKIYQGPLKQICLPGLNCYSCLGALGSCPIGALQSVLASRDYHMSFYVVGFLIAVGALAGRLVCGFLCPFGLVQDLMHKIPLPKRMKLARLPGERWLKYLRYLIPLVFVALLPSLVVNIIGQGDPWFCKYICPSGTLMGGVPLVTLGEGFAQAAGILFEWKLLLLFFFLIFSIVYYRPFCRFICPLGAVYGLANPISFFHYEIDREKCIECGACRKACKLGIDPVKNPNAPECIRCGECVKACPHGAILPGLRLKRKKSCSGGCHSCGRCKKNRAPIAPRIIK